MHTSAGFGQAQVIQDPMFLFGSGERIDQDASGNAFVSLRPG